MAKGADETERFFTVAAVAEMLCVSPKTVRRRIADGELRAVRFGKMLRVGERSYTTYISHARRYKSKTVDL
jgi:excisionase family DNA binding protein